MGQANNGSNNPKQLKNKDKIHVLDASAIYNGILTHDLDGEKFIPECVLAEIKDLLRGEAIIEEALLYDDLKVSSPEQKFLTKIRKSANETGDIQELSDCDLAVLALALDLQAQGRSSIIITDDYDIQNLASHLRLAYRGIHWKGITKTHKYLWVCPGCGEKSAVQRDDCLECGTKLQRKTHKQKIRKKGG